MEKIIDCLEKPGCRFRNDTGLPFPMLIFSLLEYPFMLLAAYWTLFEIQQKKERQRNYQ
jgi:hypothetical protein